FTDTPSTEIYPLSLHDALPILRCRVPPGGAGRRGGSKSRRLYYSGGAALSTRAITVCVAVALPCAQAAAVEPPSPSPTPAAVADQRLVFSTNGSRLTGGIGGGGGSAAWVGGLGNGTVIGAGAEYQTTSNSHWTLGTFSRAP